MRLVISFVAIICFCTSPHFCRATKKSLLDSAHYIIDTTKNVSLKINNLYTLSYEYGLIDPVLGIHYGKQCLALAVQEKNLLSQLNAYNGIGNAYETIGNYDSAKYYHGLSFEIAKTIGTRNNLVITAFNVANCYKELGDYHKALDIYLKAYSFIESQKDYNPRIHYYLADIYFNLKQFQEAEFHALRGIGKTLHTDYEYIAYNHSIILAKCLYQRHEKDSAISILHDALSGLKTHTDLNSISICLNALGEIYLNENNFDSALVIFKEELAIQEETLNKNGIAIANLNLALCYAKTNQFSLAKIHLNNTINHLYTIRRNKDVLMKAYHKIAVTYETVGDNYDALLNYKKYYQVRDSLVGQENIRQINQLQAEFANEKKERTIKLQQAELDKQQLLLGKQTFRLLALISIFIALLLIITLLYYRYRSQQKIKFITEVQRLENTKALAVQEKENEERMRIARNIHDELGSGISKLFLLAESTLPLVSNTQKASDNIKSLSKTAKILSENMRDLVWTLDPDNNTLDNLIAKMHEYSSDFFEEFSIRLIYEIAPTFPAITISKESRGNLFLVYKEALNNLIKHAGADQVHITMTHDQHQFYITIKDNGKGFDLSDVRKTANGLKNMATRMKTIQGDLSIDCDESGTTVKMIYPLPGVEA